MITTNNNIINEACPAPMAIIYRSEMDYISRCILDYQHIETGGQLFGFLTEYGVPVVCYAIGPGRNANHEVTFFNQDTHYLQSIYNELNRRYQLQYIGEWHSHHQLGLAKPSGHDAQTIINGIERHQFRHFLLCIGNCSNGRSTLNAFTFHLNHPDDYQHVPWKVCEMTSPYRPIVDRDLKHLLVHPHAQPHLGENFFVSNQGYGPQMIVPNYHENYWLNEKSNNLVLKNIIDYLTFYFGNQDVVKPMLDKEKHVQLQIIRGDHNETISFDSQFPFSAPNIVMEPEIDTIQPPDWTYLGDADDIFECFIQYYDKYINAYYEAMSSSNTNPTEEETSSWNYWIRFKNYIP